MSASTTSPSGTSNTPAPSRITTLQPADIAVVVVYLLLVMAVGIWVSVGRGCGGDSSVFVESQPVGLLLTLCFPVFSES